MSQNLINSITKTKVDKSRETLLDRLYDSYLDEEAEAGLTEVEMTKRSQIEAAWSLLVNYHSFEQSVPLLMSRFDLSRATAYRMLTNATKLFGDVTQTSKQGLRHILYEYSMKVFQLAASQKPPDLKQMNTAIKNMAMLKGLNSEDTSAFDAELLQAHTYLIQISAGVGKEPLTLDTSKIAQLPEHEYEELVDAVESTGLGDELIDNILDNIIEEPEREDEDE
ncbi:hypothetical protein [Pontibacter beigongshangensis]|uniref:hypothetical protein n=1 Tax=Pontibacter beigongshangensis TaxID=2574733 RepID=UPI00164FB6E9|nr:hypothetical protein [Pontibacter beigongshangensis]